MHRSMLLRAHTACIRLGDRKTSGCVAGTGSTPRWLKHDRCGGGEGAAARAPSVACRALERRSLSRFCSQLRLEGRNKRISSIADFAHWLLLRTEYDTIGTLASIREATSH